MRASNFNTALVEGYLSLLSNLSPDNKLDLIAQLTLSVKKNFQGQETAFKKAFGAFESEKSAEEIIEEIRASRVCTRETESF